MLLHEERRAEEQLRGDREERDDADDEGLTFPRHEEQVARVVQAARDGAQPRAAREDDGHGPAPEGLAQLKDAYATWPFFRSLVDLVELEISKADPAVSSYYDKKCCAADANLTALGEELRTKLAAAVAIFLKISGKPSLLAEQPKTKKAFDARAKYLNALHALQGEAMGRMRAAGAPDEATDEYRQLNDAMIVTVQGIAAGMNNTG